MNTKVRARLEQIRQARKIHGGMVNMCAAAVGVKLSRLRIPSRKMRERMWRSIYGHKYQALREEEMDRPIGDFRSFNELFTRGLRAECRPLSEADGQFVCPCDGTVQDMGILNRNSLLTAKGIEYPLEDLVPGIEVSPFENGNFSIFFLSPADCHRVFCPYEAMLQGVTHVPGRRLLVHPPYQRKEFPVFSLNERIILHLETEIGRCLLVLVAGWGVGNITYPFAARCRVSNRRLSLRSIPLRRNRTKKIKPNKRVRMSRHQITRAGFEEPLRFERGQWIATFELGSTVILITPPQEDAMAHIETDQKVNYGQPAYSFVKES